MIIDHVHSDAVPSKDADLLEEQIEGIEESIIVLINEIKRRLPSQISGEWKVLWIFAVIILFLLYRMAFLPFLKEFKVKVQISKLEKENCRLKKQNRKLKHLLRK